MDLDKLKQMAVTSLIHRHIQELQTASTPEALAAFALTFRDELAAVIEFDPMVDKPDAQVGLKMS